MGLLPGQYDFKNFSTQIHDFDPGIHPYPGGLFWTVPTSPIHPDEINERLKRQEAKRIELEDIELGDGTTHLSATDLVLQDYFSIPNALLHFLSPLSVGASCSFYVQWSGPVTSKVPVTTPGSSGELSMCQATMTWSANNDLGFSFVSEPSGTTSAFAELGRIKNGVFV